MKRLETGDLCLRRIPESMGAAFRPEVLFPQYDQGMIAAHPKLAEPGFWSADAGKLVSSIHAWTFRTAGKTVLVDTCAGRRKSAPSSETPPFLASLRTAQIEPEDVDIVFLTHLHTDHISWNTQWNGRRWVPFFPNARYLFGTRELAHWSPGGAGLSLYPGQADIIAQTVTPLLEAGVADLVGDEQEILPGVRTAPAPGHTATQLNLIVEGHDQSVVFAADAFHHPIQVFRPDWGSCFCEDQAAAHQTRLRLLAHCAATGSILLPSHFGTPHAATIFQTLMVTISIRSN